MPANFRVPFRALIDGQGFEIGHLRRAQCLEPFAGKIFGEAGQRQARPVDRGLLDGALEAIGAGQQAQAQVGGVLHIKFFDRNLVGAHVTY